MKVIIECSGQCTNANTVRVNHTQARAWLMEDRFCYSMSTEVVVGASNALRLSAENHPDMNPPASNNVMYYCHSRDGQAKFFITRSEYERLILAISFQAEYPAVRTTGNMEVEMPRKKKEEKKTKVKVKAVIKKTYKGELFKIVLKRTTKGVTVFLKSQFIEDYFSSLTPSGSYLQSERLGTQAHEIRDLRSLQDNLTESLNLNTCIRLNNYGAPGGPFGRGFDMALLRTVGIGKGVTVTYTDLPVSKGALETYARNVQRFVSALYKQEHEALTVEASVKAEEKPKKQKKKKSRAIEGVRV